MTDNRKSIRVTIPATDRAKFEQAKAKAENAAMIRLTDTQYASRLIQWALSHISDVSVMFSKDENGNISMSVMGRPGTDEYSAACRAAMLYEEDI